MCSSSGSYYQRHRLESPHGSREFEDDVVSPFAIAVTNSDQAMAHTPPSGGAVRAAADPAAAHKAQAEGHQGCSLLSFSWLRNVLGCICHEPYSRHMSVSAAA